MTTPTDPTRSAGYPTGTSFGGGTEPAVFDGTVSGGPSSGPPKNSYPQGSSSNDTGDALKQAGRQTAGTAQDEAKKVATTAGEQAAQVKDEAGVQVRRLVDETLTEARTQTDSQMTRLGERLREIAEEVQEMASGPQQHGVASQFAGDLAARGGRIADWLEGHGPDEALTEVRRYARRNPTTFLALAAGAGLVVGRFARALQEGSPAADATGQTSGQRAYGSYDPRPYDTGTSAYGQDGPVRAERAPYDPAVEPTAGPASAGRRLQDTAEVWDDQR